MIMFTAFAATNLNYVVAVVKLHSRCKKIKQKEHFFLLVDSACIGKSQSVGADTALRVKKCMVKIISSFVKFMSYYYL